MLVTGINIATTQSSLHINQVKLHYTGYQSPFGMSSLLTLLTDNLQIDSRGKRHLILTGTVIAVTLVPIIHLPCIIGGGSICLIIWIAAVCLTNSRLMFRILCEEHVTGQITQVVHDAVDTKVVTMLAGSIRRIRPLVQ